MTTTPPPGPLKILVPVDFSEPSRRALGWALEYAVRVPSELHLLHVIEYHLSDLIDSGLRPDDDRLKEVSDQAQQTLHELFPEHHGKVQMTRHVAVGRAGSEILRIADKLGAQLIVIGGHGKDKLPEVLIGSTTEKVVRHASCPVVCVKEPRS